MTMSKHWRGLALVAVGMALLAGGVNRAYAEDEAAPVKAVKYSETFADPKKVESESETITNLKVYPSFGLSSVNGGPGFVIYDLDSIIPTRDPAAKVTLVYGGGANGPAAQRGVAWAVSTDGKEWKDISQNEFDKPVQFSGKYLRATIKWVQAGGPDYGFLKQFTLKTAVKQDAPAAAAAPDKPAAK